MSTLAIPSTSVLNRLARPARIAPEFARLAPVGPDMLDATFRNDPGSVAVPGIRRSVRVKLARSKEEYEQIFQLVASKYQASGYEAVTSKLFRFTPYHALPETAVFAAKLQNRVVATLSAVPDNAVLGLPMEAIYPGEINALRQQGRKLVEVTSLADRDLSMREFVPVFVTLMGVMAQFASHQGADTWVITVNPRHRLFYQKVMGFVPIGAQKAYPAVQNHPAEAFAGTIPLLAANAPAMYEQIFREALPESVLAHSSMSVELVRYFAAHSSQTNLAAVEEILERIVVNQDAGH
jgi:hypothetical protein